MNKLTLVLNCRMEKELKDYLLSLDGVKNVKIDSKIYWNIDVEYDEKKINLQVLKCEIFAFLDIMRLPSLINFDKHSKNRCKKHKIVIIHLCCEFCYSSFIDELFMTEGIESAFAESDDIDNRENVGIEITYDETKIDKDLIDKLEKDFNS